MGQRASAIAEIVPELREKLPDLPAPNPLPPTDARLRLFDCLISFLGACSYKNGLLVVLDNLQWADASSLQFLEHMAAEMRESRVLVLGTYREEELGRNQQLGSTLGELIKHPAFLRVRLKGLSRNDVRGYLESTLGRHKPTDLIEKVHRRTEGNPLFLVEMARYMEERGHFDGWEQAVPEGVREAIGRRLARLGEKCVSLLSMAATIGRSFELALLTRVLRDGTTDEEMLERLEQAQAAGLIDDVEGPAGRCRFSHVLVQETLLSELSTTRKVRRHAKIAEAMEELYGHEAGGHAAELARHLAEAAGHTVHEKVVRYTLQAAEHALTRYAPEEALQLVNTVLAVREGQGMAITKADADTAALLYARGRALHDMMDPVGTEQSLFQAFGMYEKIGDKAHAIEVSLTPTYNRDESDPSPSWQTLSRGSVELQERALALAEPGSVEQGWLLSQQSPIADREKALEIARRENNQALEMWALPRLAHSCLQGGRFSRSAEYEAQAIELAERVGDTAALRFCHHVRWYRCLRVGDTKQAWASIEVLVDSARKSGSRQFLCDAHHEAARVACSLGNWDVCREHAQRCISLESGRVRTHSLVISLMVLAMAEFETGRFEAAENYLRMLGSMPGSRSVPAPQAAARIALVTGDARRLAEADAIIRQCAPGFEPSHVFASISRYQVPLALSAAFREDAEDAAGRLEYFEKTKGYFHVTECGGNSADRLAGLLCAVLGNLDRAATHFEDALGFCRRTGFRPELAWTCYDYAETLLRRNARGDRSRALELLNEALVLTSDLQMQPLRERVENRLRRSESVSPGRPFYPAGLSRREVDVLQLVARGFTNREIGERLFISHRTVATHLRNVFEKTGMANRAEATAFAMREGLIED
jgi:DNA-binding CsgD family transcriptional regulator/tetratricopeptide (TPR) repeat protein